MKSVSFAVVMIMLTGVGCAKRFKLERAKDSNSGLSQVDMTFSGLNAELKKLLKKYTLKITPQGACAAKAGVLKIDEIDKPIVLNSQGNVSLANKSLTRNCEYLIQLKFAAPGKDGSGNQKVDYVYANYKTSAEDKIASEGDRIKTDKEKLAPKIKVFLTKFGEDNNYGVYGGTHESDGKTDLSVDVNFGAGADILGSYATACVLKAGTVPANSLWIKRSVKLAFDGMTYNETLFNAANCPATALISTETGKASFAVQAPTGAGTPIDLAVTERILTPGAQFARLNTEKRCGFTSWAANVKIDLLKDAKITDLTCKALNLGHIAKYDLVVKDGNKLYFGDKTAKKGDTVVNRPVGVNRAPWTILTK